MLARFGIMIFAGLLGVSGRSVAYTGLVMQKTVHGGCVGPATLEEVKKKADFGDLVTASLTAFSQDYDGSRDESNAVKKTFIVGRHNVPAVNESMMGMCKGEVRQLVTKVGARDNSPAISYIVELHNIVEKGRLRSM